MTMSTIAIIYKSIMARVVCYTYRLLSDRIYPCMFNNLTLSFPSSEQINQVQTTCSEPKFCVNFLHAACNPTAYRQV